VEWGLTRISSRELSEWEAYEREYGPINDRWRDDVLALVHEQLQQLNRLTGAAHFTSKNHRKNPVPEPKKIPRPWVIHEEEEPEGEELEDYTSRIQQDFWSEPEPDDDEEDPEG
jgi:hypothetical protein